MFADMYAVGKAHPKLKVGDMELRCEYEEGTWIIYVLLPNMAPLEARSIQTGKISFTFAVIEDELFLLGKLGQFEWFAGTVRRASEVY